MVLLDMRVNLFGLTILVAFCLAPCAVMAQPGEAEQGALDGGLIGHWPLAGDPQDRSGQERHASARGGLDWRASGPRNDPGTAVGFNGRDGLLEVPAGRAPRLGTSDFSIAAWVDVPEELDDVPGDILSQYDPERRRGFHVTVKTNAGVTFSQPNLRSLQFGIDDHRESDWLDCGRPGEAVLAFALAVHEGELYAGTCEPADGQAGRVYRYAGGQRWLDCGAPDGSNAVTALAVHNGQLYAGTGKYRLAGSALAESPNVELGGRTFRYGGGTTWIECGRLPEVEAVGGMVVFRGRLYAASLYRPAGFFRYEDENRWTACPTPGGQRVEALGVYNGFLYATSYDGGYVYRYDGQSWTDCGRLGENTQTYAFAVLEGRLFTGTWPSGRVYRFEDINRWTDVGRLGEELEVMGMLVHNGRLIAGTLPLAEVYAYENGSTWERLARLDHTPDVKYRRAWTLAEHAGRLYCGTLPSGRVYSFAVGQNVSWDYPFPAGWHHVAAIKGAEHLTLFVDGQQVAQSDSFDAGEYELSGDRPLRIGFGRNDYFHGRLADVRLYGRALDEAEIKRLAAR